MNFSQSRSNTILLPLEKITTDLNISNNSKIALTIGRFITNEYSYKEVFLKKEDICFIIVGKELLDL